MALSSDATRRSSAFISLAIGPRRSTRAISFFASREQPGTRAVRVSASWMAATIRRCMGGGDARRRRTVRHGSANERSCSGRLPAVLRRTTFLLLALVACNRPPPPEETPPAEEKPAPSDEVLQKRAEARKQAEQKAAAEAERKAAELDALAQQPTAQPKTLPK